QVDRALGQLGGQPAQPRPEEDGPVGLADVGRDAERVDGGGVAEEVIPGGDFPVRQRQNRWLPVWFVGYLVGVGGLFLSLPRLLAQPYLMPWDYWWVFLLVTPTVAAGFVALGIRSGRFSGWAVSLFYLAAVALGLWLGWFSYQLAGVV